METPQNAGVLVPIPKYGDRIQEFENPTELNTDIGWKLITVRQAYLQGRKRSMNELLFCMLRSGH